MPCQYPLPWYLKTSRKSLRKLKKNQIFRAAAAGKAVRAIARCIELPKTTVSGTIQKGPKRAKRSQKFNLWSGPCKTIAADDKFLEKAAIIASFWSLRELHTNIMPTVCKCTVQRRLKEKNIQKHRQCSKPLLISAHRQKYLTWALAHES